MIAEKRAKRTMRGLGDTYTFGDAPTDPNAQPSVWDNFIQQAPAFIKDVLAIKNTQELYDLNLERARQGLAPINAATVAPRVNVGLTPSTQNAALGALAIGAIVLLAVTGKRRRG